MVAAGSSPTLDKANQEYSFIDLGCAKGMVCLAAGLAVDDFTYIRGLEINKVR